VPFTTKKTVRLDQNMQLILPFSVYYTDRLEVLLWLTAERTCWPGPLSHTVGWSHGM
jgi:hypothetical protein